MIQAKDIDDIEALELISSWWSAVRSGEEPDYESRHAYPALCQRFPAKVVEAKFKALHRRGYLEFGGNVTGSWLSLKGEAFLANRGAPLE